MTVCQAGQIASYALLQSTLEQEEKLILRKAVSCRDLHRQFLWSPTTRLVSQTAQSLEIANPILGEHPLDKDSKNSELMNKSLIGEQMHA